MPVLLQIIVSDASEPGEGEHKIMRLIRDLRSGPGYRPNTRHVVFGQDADLLLLSLLLHEPHVFVMRELFEQQVSSEGGAAPWASWEGRSQGCCAGRRCC